MPLASRRRVSVSAPPSMVSLVARSPMASITKVSLPAPPSRVSAPLPLTIVSAWPLPMMRLPVDLAQAINPPPVIAEASTFSKLL